MLRSFGWLLTALLGIGLHCGAQDEPFDLVLTGGRVLDGSGNPWFRADVGIRSGRIVAVGRLADEAAKRRLDVTGHIVAPGFIDLHSHADGGLADRDAARRAATNLVTQGITTVVVNQDGRSNAPIAAQRARFTELGIGVNAALLVGHGTIRQRVMGRDHRRPATNDEVERMAAAVRQALKDGAYGISAGLEYVPGRWATTEEMVELVAEVAAVDGVYILHERSSGTSPMWYLPSRDPPAQPSMLDNIRELIEVGERTGAVVVATHVKVKGTDFWGSAGAIVRLIDEARSRGVRIYADQYPYNTSGTDGRVVLVPSWLRQRVGENGDGLRPAQLLEKALADESIAADLARDIEHEIMRRGGAEQIVVLDHPDRTLIGKTLAELARARGRSATQMAITLQLEGYRDRRGGARIRGYSMWEPDVELLGAQPWTATCTDGGIALPGDGPVHPRFYGAFARKIRHYALDRGAITVEHAIRAATSLPAQILGLRDRGVIRAGTHADLVVMNLDEVRDHATAADPYQPCTGFVHVLVNGTFVVENGEPTGALPGRVIQRPDR